MKNQNTLHILKKAYKEGYAIPAINVSNLETIKAVLEAADELNTSIILQLSEMQRSCHGYSYADFVEIVHILSKGYSHGEYAIHLDHSESLEQCREAIEGGFSSVMYDGSSLSFKDNMNNTRKVKEICNNVYLEGELGCLALGEGGEKRGNESYGYTDVSKVEQFIDETKIDFLAVAIGNAHGRYMASPKLDFDLLKKINTIAGIPLVLHGASGLTDLDIAKAIDNGIAKINFFTELDEQFREGFMSSSSEGNYMMFACREGQNRMKQRVKEILSLCMRR